MERLDKIISAAANVSRNDARTLIRKGLVAVNGSVVRDISGRYDENESFFTCNGKGIKYSRYVYIMMNKPKGVISASVGGRERTVIDILPDSMKRKNLFPAGRLDKDTTGFVLITDDGGFAHRILSPKNHIPKTYIARLDKPFGDEIISEFKRGVQLEDDICMPAELTALNSEKTLAQVEISQGMYHQVKRMFAKYSLTVVELKRIKMGGLLLDENLKEGDCRYITQNELITVEKGK